ncbi:hypothetical protein [Nannocystis pusilla]|uniref:hypothetical protein n=1 Tax=Nannocystis pusilla TaxID=889268 RepID=UPI003DA418E0
MIVTVDALQRPVLRGQGLDGGVELGGSPGAHGDEGAVVVAPGRDLLEPQAVAAEEGRVAVADELADDGEGLREHAAGAPRMARAAGT